MTQEMEKITTQTLEIPDGYEARIDGNKVIIERKESEDEQIRKEIIFILKNADSGKELTTLHGTKEMIAYLERQKEQKPKSCDCSRDEESYMNGIHHVLMNPEAYGLIKQKPASISYNHENDSKPAEWSEEDVIRLEDAITLVEHHHDKEYNWFDYDDLATWLKSLPERFNLQPKQEWSEEDDALLKEIVSFFKDGTVKLQHDLDLYAGFLEKKFKSLRPQPHWKPSEEQMKWLKDVIETVPMTCRQQVPLESLYNDLKLL